MKKEHNKKFYLSLLIISFLLSGCNKNKWNFFSKDEEQNEEMVIAENSDDNMIKKVVNEWNKALNLRDASLSKKVFAPIVFFYTKDLSADECIKHRNDMVIADPSWNQSIISPIDIEYESPDRATARFTKQVTSKKGLNTYRAYLVMEKSGDDWLIVKESDELTDRNVAKHKAAVKIPKDAIRGDFDGDGQIDHIWTDAKYDSEGYATSSIRLKSDNPNLEGISWSSGLLGVILVNLGDLNGSNRDFFGAIPHGMSNWCTFETYGYKDAGLKKVLDTFQIWLGDENLQRVYRSDTKGNVYILYNVMDGEDFSTHQMMKTLRF